MMMMMMEMVLIIIIIVVVVVINVYIYLLSLLRNVINTYLRCFQWEHNIGRGLTVHALARTHPSGTLYCCLTHSMRILSRKKTTPVCLQPPVYRSSLNTSPPPPQTVILPLRCQSHNYNLNTYTYQFWLCHFLPAARIYRPSVCTFVSNIVSLVFQTIMSVTEAWDSTEQ